MTKGEIIRAVRAERQRTLALLRTLEGDEALGQDFLRAVRIL